MRVLRLRVANYRGVAAREVRFAERGVTVVQGDNEVGKTSLAEAIDRIFEYRDDSTRKEVRELQPVGRDVGTEIEVDVEIGPVSLTYVKRFHRDRMTELTIHSPRTEQLRGREAHERVRALLDAHVDQALWKALRVQQGSAQLAPDLRHQTSLAAALDEAAQGALGGEREASVVDLVLEEYHQYFTATGRRNAALEAKSRLVESAEAALAELERKVAELEADTERHAELGTRIAELRTTREERRLAVSALQSQVGRLDAAANQIDRMKAEADAAAMAQAMAEDALEARRHKVALLAQLTADRDAFQSSRDGSAGPLAQAAAARDEAREAYERAKAGRRAARELARLRRADHVRLEAADRLEHLRAQLERLAEVRAVGSAARAELATAGVDEATLEQLEAAHLVLLEARAKVDSQSPVVTVDATTALRLTIDGRDEIAVADGASVTRTVSGTLRVAVPGVGVVTVDAGRSVEAHAADLALATEAFDDALAAAGVADLTAARASARRRHDAERTLRELGDTDDHDTTAAEIARLEAVLAAESEARPAIPAEAIDADEALTLADEAEHEADRLDADAERLEELLTAAVAEFDRLDRDDRKAEALIASATEHLIENTAELAAVRETEPDAVLEAVVVEKAMAATEAQKAWVEARTALEDLHPDQVAADLAHARSVLDGVERDLRAAENDRVALAERIAVRGEEGLHDRVQEAAAILEETRRERDSWEGRAAAAALLHETLDDHRRKAQQAYHRPLREQIEQLGRVVFGTTFAVELDEHLEIARRTLDGQTLDAAQLSLGTREQLSVIARLACATLVAGDGGVPLVLDDALGFSDPGRLERLGAMFASAAADCQVIVLTCVPERYRNVAAAAVVRL